MQTLEKLYVEFYDPSLIQANTKEPNYKKLSQITTHTALTLNYLLRHEFIQFVCLGLIANHVTLTLSAFAHKLYYQSASVLAPMLHSILTFKDSTTDLLLMDLVLKNNCKKYVLIKKTFSALSRVN